MSESTWFLHVFEVADAHSQDLIAKSLQDEQSVVVEPRSVGPDSYVIVGCADVGQGQPILRTVLAVDPTAKLIHRAEGHDPVGLWPGDDPAL
jgi:hypothetical protein